MSRRVLVALASLCVMASAGGAESLDNDFRKQLADWHQATTIGAYKQVGVRQPAWDPAAIRLLWVYWPMLGPKANAAALQRLLDAAKPLRESGCTGPLVQYALSAAYRLNGDPVEAEKWLRQAVEGYRTSRYPKSRAWWAPQRLAELCRQAGGEKQKEADQWQNLAVEWVTQAAGEAAVKAGLQRAFWADIRGTILDAAECDPDQMVAALSGTPGVDPWVAHMAAGSRGIDLAWGARGDEWAYKVTDAGWAGFEKHMEAAREHLVQAWKLHPEYPEAASRMIAVAMGMGEPEPGPDAATTRQWFDRAVTAQFDYLPAYNAYAWSLHPRWGGSVDELYAFGLACLNTGRFDTAVPGRFWTAVHDIATDEESPDIWRREGVYAGLARYFQGVLDQPPGTDPKQSPEANQTRWLGAAWACGQYDEALKLARELGDRVDANLFRDVFQTESRLAIAEALAATGPLGPEVRTAITLGDGSDLKAAEAAFRGLMARNQDPQAAVYLRDRAEALRLENALQGTAWTSFQPDANFAGFGGSGGPWKVEADGSLMAVVPGGGNWWSLASEARVRGGYEIRGEISLDPARSDILAGVLLNYVLHNPPAWNVFSLDHDTSTGSGRAGLLGDHTEVEIRAHNTFLLRVRDRKADGFVNDKQVCAGTDVPEYALKPDTPTYVGFYVYARGAKEATARFSKMEIRGLR